MKRIKYKVSIIQRIYNPVADVVEDKNALATVIVPWSEENEEIAKRDSHNGEYTIEDDGVTVAPTQLDVIEAQVAYTAMMTDTLLEV